MNSAAAIARLAAAGVSEPARDAQKLFDWAYREGVGDGPQSRDTPNARTVSLYEDAIVRRVARQPVAQIIGRRAFWCHEFHVTPDVLDPRPDTETLVEVALDRPFERVLDLGTGSGCILLSLLAERDGATGLGTDVSDAALRVAKRNAQDLGINDRAAFSRSDWFAHVSGVFDLIVSNPPYISVDAYAALMPEVRDWEPRGALTPGGDGLEAYRIICAQAHGFLRRGGRLCLEIGYDQAASVMTLCEKGGLVDIATHHDLNSKCRVVSAQRPA